LYGFINKAPVFSGVRILEDLIRYYFIQFLPERNPFDIAAGPEFFHDQPEERIIHRGVCDLFGADDMGIRRFLQDIVDHPVTAAGTHEYDLGSGGHLIYSIWGVITVPAVNGYRWYSFFSSGICTMLPVPASSLVSSGVAVHIQGNRFAFSRGNGNPLFIALVDFPVGVIEHTDQSGKHPHPVFITINE
jgi:hypothetical protein